MPRLKRPHRPILYLLSVFLVTLSIFTVFGERGGLHLWRLWQEKKKLEEKNFLLQRENEILRERVYRLRHDDRYLEKIAREELNLVRPGEIIYRFASSESKRNRSQPVIDPISDPPRSSAQKPRR
ncbi:MAG: septum formation initiator family protein [Deltaproteobacteria bacterium]|nr:septum formation initiator family protein [Deltaproteobacteria bacterium]